MYMDFLIFLEKLAEASEEDAGVQQSKKIRAADVDINLEVSFFSFRYIQKYFILTTDYKIVEDFA